MNQALLTISEPIWLPLSYSNTTVGGSGVQSVIVQQNGALEANQSGPVVQLGLWNSNRTSLITNGFEFMLQSTSGAWVGNSTGVWLNFPVIGPSITWICLGVPNSVAGILHLRRIGSTVTLRSCPISLTNN